MRAESRPFTVDEYEAMGRAGILTDEDRVELIGPGGSISPLAFPELTVAVDDVLPAAS